MTDSTNNRPNFQEPSIDTQILEGVLDKAEEGELLTYKKLSDAIGRPVQIGRGRGYLDTARRRQLHDKQRNFITIRNEGIKLAAPEECVEDGQSAMVASRRKARRGRKKLASADYDRLNAQDQVKHNTIYSTLGIMEMITKAPRQKKLGAAVAKAQNNLLPDRMAIDVLFNGEKKAE